MANKRTRGSRGSPACTGGGSIGAPITLPNTDANRTYNLDGLGNWKTSVYTPVGGSQTAGQRNHNYVNEITQSVTSNLSPVTFVYDGATGASNGNLKNDGTLIYSYDALNRPIQINRVSDGLVIATYVYDALNRRVRRTVTNGGITGNIPNGETDYIYMGGRVVEERNSSDAPIRQYVWGTYIDECIQLTTLVVLGPQSLPTGAYYLLQDLLYRAVALTNASGAVVEAYDTDTYGNTIIFTGPGADGVWFTDDDVQSSYGANEIIYCGYRYDPETELYYVRNRTYNPPLGRWLQRDPIGYAGGINLYEYVTSAPTIRLDIFGLDCCAAEQKALQAALAAERRADAAQRAALAAWLAGPTGTNSIRADEQALSNAQALVKVDKVAAFAAWLTMLAAGTNVKADDPSTLADYNEDVKTYSDLENDLWNATTAESAARAALSKAEAAWQSSENALRGALQKAEANTARADLATESALQAWWNCIGVG